MDPKVFQEQFGLFGNTEIMNQVILKIGQVAPTDITILLNGESGVGKDVTARAIHGLSNRKKKDLVIVNCGAIPEGIIESELFGHEKGAFTGAQEAREGYFERANAGTIFLDEIGDTPQNVQVKLLRILENGEYFRVGSSELRKTDVRVIAATNKDLWNLVEKGSFREDLYYRLNTVQIVLPPLRDRQEDIIPIFRKFVVDFSQKYDSVFQGFSDDAKALLMSYRWPGNIRELRNVAEQLVVLEKSNFVTGVVLRKYLKGRQNQGNTDNLPIKSQFQEQKNAHFDESPTKDRELIFRALIDLKTDVSELKKLIAQFMYSSNMSDTKGLLPAMGSYSNSPTSFSPDNLEPILDNDISLGINNDDANQIQDFRAIEEPKDEFEQLLDNDDVPSIEDAERYLIQKALKKFKGNRRKASEALGVSERTLYRKIDQYGFTE